MFHVKQLDFVLGQKITLRLDTEAQSYLIYFGMVTMY